MKGVDLDKALSHIEKKEGISFSYKSDIVKGVKVDLRKGKYPIFEILADLCTQSNLTFEQLDSIHFIFTPINLGHRMICGHVQDSMSHEKLPFVDLISDDMSITSSTNKNGFFSMVIPSDKSIFARYIGFKDKELHIESSIQGCKTYELAYTSHHLEEVVLVEYLVDGISQSDNSNSVVIQPDKMRFLPGTVDRDILSTIQFLPGVNSPKESLDGIHVRGGTPDQNLILWDGIPVFNNSHFFGNISAFNPFIIEDVEVQRGGIGSEYGGRVSSVIDIHSLEKVPEYWALGAGANMTHWHFNVAMPLWKNSGLYFSNRNSFTESITTPTFKSYAEKVFQGTKVQDVAFNKSDNDRFKFNDGNFKWIWEIGTNRFTVSSIGALNSLQFNTELSKARLVDALEISSGGVGFNWEKKWNRRLQSTLSLTGSEFYNRYTLKAFEKDSEEQLPFGNGTDNTLSDAGIKFDFNYMAKKDQYFKYGMHLTSNEISLTIDELNEVRDTSQRLNFENSLVSIYGEYGLTIPNLLKLDIGLRHQRSLVKKTNYFEPRISASIQLNEDLRLKMSTGKHFQFVSQVVVLDINELGLSNRIWVAANNSTIPVIEANQWSGGIIYEKNDWTLDVEGYVKELAGITALFESVKGQPFIQGNARIRGIDVLLKRRFKDFRSWLSYSISRTLYDFPSIDNFLFPAPQDQRTVLGWVNLLKKGRWEFSLGVQLKSGLPFTSASGVDSLTTEEDRVIPFIVYDKINGSRLKPYFRVDGTIAYNFRISKRTKGYISLSLQNITNRVNDIDRRFILGDRNGQQLPSLLEVNESGLRFTPNLSANVLF